MKRRETKQEHRKRLLRAKKILQKLKKLFPDEDGTMLNYSNNFELLVSVILSAQCTDKRVNEVTKTLFKKYRTLDDYVNADPREFEKDIYRTGFYRNKTKSILGAARMLKEDFDGKIPKTMKEILRLPGVARKTANVVLGNAHGVVEGIAVDTHVKRLARLWGLTDEDVPDKIERDLMDIFRQDDWFLFTYLAIEYGRQYCAARKKDHSDCPLSEFELTGK